MTPAPPAAASPWAPATPPQSAPAKGAPTLAAVRVGLEFAAPEVRAVELQQISTTPTSPAPGPAPLALSRFAKVALIFATSASILITL